MNIRATQRGLFKLQSENEKKRKENGLLLILCRENVYSQPHSEGGFAAFDDDNNKKS